MENSGKNIRVFCLFDNEQELELFLKSELAQSELERYLVLFSTSEEKSLRYPSFLNNRYITKNITIPKRLTEKWKTTEFEEHLSCFLNKFKKTEQRKHIYLDFSNVKINEKVIDCIETSLEERLAEYSTNYSIFTLFLEKNLSSRLTNKLALQYPYLCLKASQIYPNFYYESLISKDNRFPTSLREIYQPIQILFDELEKNNLELEHLNKEIFMLKTQNNILEASLASIFSINKKQTKTKSTPADLISLLEYHDLKQRYNQKAQILSTVIHDLKSPLAAIQGFAELLRDGLAGPVSIEIKKHLEVIITNSKRLTRMIESLLEFERYDRSDYIAQRERFDLIELFEEAKISVLPQMIQKGHEVQIYTPDTLEIVANRELIFRVLQNLLDNAIKYTPQNKGKIELFAEEQSIKGHKIIKITIKDEGYGFSEHNLKKAFEPFTRFESDSTSTGLGLSISKKIVEDIHGGSIEIISSGKNKGTTVVVMLPKS